MAFISVFEQGLKQLEKSSKCFFGPRSFQDFTKESGYKNLRTADYISINTLSQLDKLCRDSNVMVLRLGASPQGTGTQFLLVQANSIKDFFLIDDEVFSDSDFEDFESLVPQEKLLSYRLLPKLSETSLVNLALASGVLSQALGLDISGSLMPPATGHSTFDFKVKPLQSTSQVFSHRNGQVEIDTLFAERRNGEWVVFVIEAKTAENNSTLSKHKLVYPILAIAERVPDDFDIVPLYLRAKKIDDCILFQILECHFSDPRKNLPAITELKPVNSTNIQLKL